MGDDAVLRLAACANQYVEAVRELQDGSAQDLADSTTAISARLAFYDCLIQQGWTPPAAVAEMLALDRRLLAEPSHDGHDLPAPSDS